MIFVKTEENKIFGPIDSWRTLHLGKKVKELIITDGERLSKTLSGFDSYTIAREAVAGISSSGAPCKKQGVVKESIIGIKDLSRAKKELLEAFNAKIKELASSDNNQFLMERCRGKYEDMLRIIEGYEVVSFDLEIKVTTKPLSDLVVDKIDCKPGLSNVVSAKDILGKNYMRKLK